MNKFYLLEKIETPRLIIRPVQLGDEIVLNKAIHNSLALLQQWMVWANDPSLETTREFVQNGVFVRTSQTIGNFPMVFICKKNNKIIGATGYNDESKPLEDYYEIGYWCDVGYQGKGYVTEVVNALTQYAIKEMVAKTVAMRIQVENLKSIAVAERLGFKNEGTCPSLTMKGTTDYYYTCTDCQSLPSLDLTWTYPE